MSEYGCCPGPITLSSNKILNIEFVLGDTYGFTCQYVNSCRSVIDITYAQITMIAKSDPSVPDSLAYFTIMNDSSEAIQILNGPEGIMQVTIPEAATLNTTWNNAVYQLKIEIPDAIPPIRDTVLNGVIHLLPNLLIAS